MVFSCIKTLTRVSGDFPRSNLKAIRQRLDGLFAKSKLLNFLGVAFGFGAVWLTLLPVSFRLGTSSAVDFAFPITAITCDHGDDRAPGKPAFWLAGVG